MYLSLHKNGGNVSVQPVPPLFRRASDLCLAGQGGLDCSVHFHFCKVDTDDMFQQKGCFDTVPQLLEVLCSVWGEEVSEMLCC